MLRPLCVGLTALAAALGVARPAAAGVVAVPEAAGVQYTTVAGVVTETFDATPQMQYTALATAAGGLSAAAPGLGVIPGDLYGGSLQTPYMGVGISNAPAATLTLPGPMSYIGMYLPALDATDAVRFLSGGSVVATFTLADIAPLLTPAYYGNPNIGGNTGEPYVYLNFYGTAGTTFDQVVFDNGGSGGGMEVDSISLLAPTAVPAPAGLVLLGSGGLALLGRRLRRRTA
ncbi:MAG: hypothetical protein K2X87_30485 [Gemmataceae bacterium]|nr:hypothetical protein [Gemmataceae bacterium]